MDTVKQVWDSLLSVWDAVNLPAGIAMLISIRVVSWVKSLNSEKEIPTTAIVPMSIGITMGLFLGYCWVVRIPIRDPLTMGNAILAGFGGPILVWALKKYTPFDPDNFFAPKEEKADGTSNDIR